MNVTTPIQQPESAEARLTEPKPGHARKLGPFKWDDALLLELAWPMLAEDVDDYRDFCHFRDEAGGRSSRPLPTRPVSARSTL